MIIYDWEKYDDAIRKTYGNYRRGALKSLSCKTGIPESTLSSRAGKLGIDRCIQAGRRPNRRFTPQEDSIICHHRTGIPAQIVTAMRRAGYEREQHSIENRMTRLRKIGRIPSREEALDTKDIYTSTTLAPLMGVSESQIARLVKIGVLQAQAQAQDSQRVRRYLIKRKDLREFLLTRQPYWDHRLCDQYFLVDILAGDTAYSPSKIQDRCGVRHAAAGGYEEHGVAA